MRIAMPVESGKLVSHFGRCREFALIDADGAMARVLQITTAVPPPHAPGVLPAWLREQQVTHVIAAGMGGHAQDMLRRSGIEVVTGAPGGDVADLAIEFLNGRLQAGANICSH
jgi:predicted Fe-Mo cluster-binding NifX family protein